MEQNAMRLCGGSFFVLLLQARGQRRNARMGSGRVSDGKREVDVLSNLVYLVNNDFIKPAGRTFDTFTSKYKTCKTSDTPSASITNERIVKRFDDAVTSDYSSVFDAFSSLFVKTVSWDSEGAWLVAALIDLIEADATIPDDAIFYVRPFGHAVAKSELRNINCICCSSFVLGVWHYIVTKIRDNTVGFDTVDNFLEKDVESRAERKFVSNIGMETVNKITTSVGIPRFEKEYATKSGLSEELLNMPFKEVMPGVSIGLNGNNVEYMGLGQVRVTSNPVFPLKDLLGENDKDKFEIYIRKSSDFYSKVKTLLYAETPRKLDDFYVPNDLSMRVTGTGGRRKIFDTSIFNVISGPFKDIVLTGTGGIGKSMMLRYLFLLFSEKYEERGLLPVLVQLKNFTSNEDDLQHFVFKSIKEFDDTLVFDDFDAALRDESCLLLLDGLDEVPSVAREKFEKDLMKFKKAYEGNIVIVSSRPTTSFLNLGCFSVLEIEPFDKRKAMQLIEKLDYHDKEIKEKFLDDLDKRLYTSHQQFASNPLLLTIMLMTYSAYGEIPAKRHIFYAKAYETMARLHDASKGAYVRPMHTELSPDEFAQYFAEFCARTYRAEVLEFTDETFAEEMAKVIKHQRNKIKATPRDFLLDLTYNLCIMYKEGDKYYFIHRSFQEYFSAVFFSQQMDNHLERIGEFFENQRERQLSDRTFDMLYDMIPDRIDKYVFLPFLRKLWDKCDCENGYWTFLDIMYPIIYVQEGEPGEYWENDPTSFLYNFLINESHRRGNGQLDNSLEWPSVIDYCNRKEWTSIKKERIRNGRNSCFTEVVEIDSIDQGYIEMNGEPEVEGVTWEIDTYHVYHNPELYADLISFMEDNMFPLKMEYNDMKALTELIEHKFEKKKSADDWFDAF